MKVRSLCVFVVVFIANIFMQGCENSKTGVKAIEEDYISPEAVITLEGEHPNASSTIYVPELFTESIVTFNAFESTDNIGIVNYEWSYDETVIGNDPVLEVSTDIFSTGSNRLRLVVLDNAGNDGFTSFLFFVSRINHPPVIEIENVGSSSITWQPEEEVLYPEYFGESDFRIFKDDLLKLKLIFTDPDEGDGIPTYNRYYSITDESGEILDDSNWADYINFYTVNKLPGVYTIYVTACDHRSLYSEKYYTVRVLESP